MPCVGAVFKKHDICIHSGDSYYWLGPCVDASCNIVINRSLRLHLKEVYRGKQKQAIRNRVHLNNACMNSHVRGAKIFKTPPIIPS